MERALMIEVVRSLRLSPPENLDRLLREHAAVDGHCRICRSVAPCTLWTATMAARLPRARTEPAT